MKKLLLLVMLVIMAGFFSAFVKADPPGKRTKKRSSLPASASLVFPVAGKSATIGSFWGAVRDGGKRKHEGIDIFARKGTPVVALSDGLVVAVTYGGKGGKTVWLRSHNHLWTEYYAHLNEQKVKWGQWVKKGQMLGTVGNTGNAKYTPSHLHFGIYTARGPVNPLQYVKGSVRLQKPAKGGIKEEMIAENNDKAKSPLVLSPGKQVISKGPINRKHIWKTIRVPADPKSRYYVTVQRNVVRYLGNRLHLIGKWEKSRSRSYPYSIHLENRQSLKVSASGKIVTSDGTAIGSVI
jgi:hypothetical protein